MHRTDMDVCGCGWFIYEKKIDDWFRLDEPFHLFRIFVNIDDAIVFFSRFGICRIDFPQVSRRSLHFLHRNIFMSFLCDGKQSISNCLANENRKENSIVRAIARSALKRRGTRNINKNSSTENRLATMKIVWRLSCSNGSFGDTFFFVKSSKTLCR